MKLMEISDKGDSLFLFGVEHAKTFIYSS